MPTGFTRSEPGSDTVPVTVKVLISIIEMPLLSVHTYAVEPSGVIAMACGVLAGVIEFITVLGFILVALIILNGIIKIIMIV